jgi:hypothetical protein
MSETHQIHINEFIHTKVSPKKSTQEQQMDEQTLAKLVEGMFRVTKLSRWSTYNSYKFFVHQKKELVQA